MSKLSKATAVAAVTMAVGLGSYEVFSGLANWEAQPPDAGQEAYQNAPHAHNITNDTSGGTDRDEEIMIIGASLAMAGLGGTAVRSWQLGLNA